MKEITLIRIAPSQNCWSSKDINLHALSDIRRVLKQVHPYNFTSSTDINEINGEIYKTHSVIIAPKHILEPRLDWNKEKIQDVANKLQFINGVKTDRPDFIEDYYILSLLKYDINREKERIDTEYVLYKMYPKTHTPKEYVGGFSLETFFEEILISYVERGLCFGYIGHNCRKVWVDKMLAEICMKHIKNEDFAAWLTSTDGRHFGDAIEGMVENEDRVGVELYIKQCLPNIHNLAVIYNHPEHKGNLKSTYELERVLGDMGMLMTTNPEIESENDNINENN